MLDVILVGAMVAGAVEEPRSAGEILREYDRLSFPSMSAGNSPEAVKAFTDEITRVADGKVALAFELFESHPGHARVPELLEGRWALLSNSLERADEVLVEVEPFLAEETEPALREAAYLARARAGVVLDDVPYATRRRFVEEAAAVAPDRAAAGAHLAELATTFTQGDDEKRALCESILARWGSEPHAAAAARGLLKQLDRIGTTCDFTFRDVVSGRRVDRAALGGPALVMIWSGGVYDTLEAEFDRLRARRARDPALPIVGIYNFRHAEGADGLRAELAARAIDWPHWYDEEEFASPWEGRFSSNRTPLYLVLDGAGVVRSVGYRLATVERRLAELRRVREV